MRRVTTITGSRGDRGRALAIGRGLNKNMDKKKKKLIFRRGSIRGDTISVPILRDFHANNWGELESLMGQFLENFEVGKNTELSIIWSENAPREVRVIVEKII